MKHRLVRLLAGSVLATALGAAWGADAGEGIVHFDISRFDVRGNTLLEPALIDATLAPFAGGGRDFGDVQRALEALEAAYRARGYSVVQVELPEQQLESGVVIFKVAELKIGRVRVSGNQYFDEANIRRSLPALAEGRVPDINAVSAAIRLANDNPAKKVSLQLQGSEQEGEIDANLVVADEQPWKGSLNLDNSGSKETGRSHVGLVLQNANLWGRDHLASLQYTTTAEEPSRVSVYGFGYHVPLYALGDSLDFFGSYSNVDSGTISAGAFNLAVSGKGATFGARYNHPLAKRDKYESRLLYGIDYKAFKNTVEVLGVDLGNNVTVHPLSITYAGNWTLADGESGVSVSLLANVPGGSRGASADFALARVGAKAAYSILRFSASASRVLPGDWQVRAIGNGQYSADALIPGEQFGAGGAASVRGFTERVLSNDVGLNTNLELYTPGWCGQGGRWQCRALVFYDAAYLGRNHALAGETTHTTVGSAGLGVRLLMGSSLSLQMDYGHVLQAGATGSGHANRLHLRLGFSY